MAFLTQIDTSTLTNQNLSSALLVHTFTNTTRERLIRIRLFLDQIAGNGDYKAWVTIQRSGAGTVYPSARTTEAVQSGETAHVFNGIDIKVGATDVVKVYVLGLAGDTTTPDIITEVSEEFINVDASGNPTPNDSAGIATLLTRIIGTLLAGNHNPQTGDAYARIGANGAGLTALGDTRLANLDAQVSTRSTLAAGAQMDLVDAPNATALTAVATAVWASATRTLTSISSLTAAISQAVWEYVTRTLTSGGGASAADIWAYATRTLTQGAASVNSAVQGTHLTQYRGATWTITLTGLGALTGYSKIYFAIKDTKADADTDALLLIEKTAGLTRLNGAAYATAADGSITIDSEPAGNLTLTVKPAATAQLEERGGLHYGVKLIRTDGTVSQLSDGSGKFNIAADLPRAIS